MLLREREAADCQQPGLPHETVATLRHCANPSHTPPPQARHLLYLTTTTTLLTRRGARGLEAFMPPPLFEKRVEVHFSMARQAGDSVGGDLWQCCSERTVFRVRSGPDYKRNGFKEPSGDTFFECVGVDVFRLSKKVRVLFLLSSSLSLCLFLSRKPLGASQLTAAAHTRLPVHQAPRPPRQRARRCEWRSAVHCHQLHASRASLSLPPAKNRVIRA